MDNVTSAQRSRIMAAIKPRGNRSTELRVASLLRQAGIRGWRRHSSLLGRPDFTFYREGLVLFVDGCFWHGCPRCGRVSASNIAFWTQKIIGNRARDRRVSQKLRRAGWSVARIWEHEIKGCNPQLPPRLLAKIKARRLT